MGCDYYLCKFIRVIFLDQQNRESEYEFEIEREPRYVYYDYSDSDDDAMYAQKLKEEMNKERNIKILYQQGQWTKDCYEKYSGLILSRINNFLQEGSYEYEYCPTCHQVTKETQTPKNDYEITLDKILTIIKETIAIERY